MSEENVGDEHVIVEGESRLTAYLDGGQICLQQESVGVTEPAVIRIKPADASHAAFAIKGMEQRLNGQPSSAG